jgi:hypothetical protein
MRTTVAIKDRLLTAAKAAARRCGYTLGRLVEVALRQELDRPSPSHLPQVPVFRGGTGPRPGLDLRSNLSRRRSRSRPLQRGLTRAVGVAIILAYGAFLVVLLRAA